MGAENLAVGEGALDARFGDLAYSLAERPLDLGELLRLHRARPAHRLGRRGERLAGEALARVTPPDRGQRVHLRQLDAYRVADELGVDLGGRAGYVGPVESEDVLGALGDEPLA